MKFTLGFIVVCVMLFIPVHQSQEMVMDKHPSLTEEIVIHAQPSIFDHVYEKLRFEEGNYAWLKNDFGGETYGGITRNYNSDWPGWAHIDEAKISLDGKKLARLKWNQAVPEAEPHVKEFYHQWWLDWNMDVIKDSLAAAYTFDFAICGTPSIKIVQKCLNKNFGYDFKVNGRMNLQMAEAINALDPVIYAESLRIMRRDFYIHISNKWHRVKDRSGNYQRDSTGNYIYAQTQKGFLNGWLNRADRIKPVLKKRVGIRS